MRLRLRDHYDASDAKKMSSSDRDSGYGTGAEDVPPEYPEYPDPKVRESR
jgi:hypothetical protein